jgi:small-conductance mechanosensitive channel
MAGFVMFFEGWYTVGSSVVIEPLKVEGVVEEVSLRATAVREPGGEVSHIHNSQIQAVRVLPNGARRIQIELFVRELEVGEELVERVARVLPAGSTAFVRPPTVIGREQLDEGLYRITADARVPPGRMWLAESLLPSLMKEQANPDVVVHGPFVLAVDEEAATRYARAERTRAYRRAAHDRRLVAGRSR